MKITNRFNLPQALIHVLLNDEYRRVGNISVTSLIGSPRIFQLCKRHDSDITVDVSDEVWKIMGSAIHYIIEKGSGDNVFKEETLTKEVSGWLLSGTADLYDGETLTDYKFTSVWSVVNRDRHPEWAKQLNIYRYLYSSLGFDVKSVENVLFLKDWSKRKARENENFPQQAVYTIEHDLEPIDEIEGYIIERIRMHQECEDLPDNSLPICTKEERWATNDKWAVRKKNNKKATKLFDSESDANILAEANKDFIVELRPARNTRCLEYCICKDFCTYYKELRDAGQC